MIPAGENFFGVARESSGGSSLYGAAASDFTETAGDLLITQAGGETCDCLPALWRLRWDGAEFQKTKLAELDDRKAEWGQVAFSPYGAELLQQQGAVPLVGPTGRPAAVGGDDLMLQEAFIPAAGGVTTVAANGNENRALRFINTLFNNGDAPGVFIISAPTSPAGFTLTASGDSGATFASLNNGGTVRTNTPVNPRSEERNIDLKVTVPSGTAVGRDYDIIIQVTSATDANRFDRTTDRLRITATAPTQCTVGPSALPGGTIGTAYSQTLTAAGATAPIAFSVSAGILPPGLSLNGTTGQLAGTPAQVGVYRFTVSAAGANGLTCSQAYELAVTQPPLTLVKTVRDVNGGLVLPGDTLEYSLTQTNVSNAAISRTFIAEFIPPNVTYIVNSVRITVGAN
ncbi:MAG: putative Ig domain-containing protein, partial [Pseudomonadota bacterium]